MLGDKSIKLTAGLFKEKRFLIKKKYFPFLNPPKFLLNFYDFLIVFVCSNGNNFGNKYKMKERFC